MVFCSFLSQPKDISTVKLHQICNYINVEHQFEANLLNQSVIKNNPFVVEKSIHICLLSRKNMQIREYTSNRDVRDRETKYVALKNHSWNVAINKNK